MKRLSCVVFAAALIVIGIGVVYWYTSPYRYSNEIQIVNILADEQTAIRNKDVKGVLAHVSSSYNDSAGNNYDSLRIMALDTLRSGTKFDSLIEHQFVTVNGDTAHADIAVTVTRTSPEGSIDKLFSGPLTISFRKYKTKRWYIVPVRAWKITSTDGLPGITE